MKNTTIHKILFGGAYLLIALLSSCGGGGGGGGSDVSVDPVLYGAEVRIERQPSSIGIGDRIYVRVDITQLNEDGIILKFAYPTGLNYLKESAKLIVDDTELSLDPIRLENEKEGKKYLAFYLDRDYFGERDEGIVIIYLRGIATVDEGSIEVDTALHTPGVAPHNEYNPENPLFSAEDSVSIEVS